MKKALIIGSTVVDVIVNLVDSLPTTGEDVHVRQPAYVSGQDALIMYLIPSVTFRFLTFFFLL